MTYSAVKETRARTQIFCPRPTALPSRPKAGGLGVGSLLCLCDHTATPRLPVYTQLVFVDTCIWPKHLVTACREPF